MFRRAPSKINLYLRVCGKLPNGYHEIETLFLPLNDPADELEISFRDDERGEITVNSDAALPTGRDNLCGKAAEAVCAALGIRPSITVFIRKHTPVAAGMGGGSSDAAAIINAVQRQYGFLPDRGASAALSCGADVPFFLNPVPAIGRGLGDQLEPLPELPPPPILTVPMPFPVSTPWSYGHIVHTDDTRPLEPLLSALQDRDYERAAQFLRNDLAVAAWKKFPLLGMTAEKLKSLGALGVQITGSGPTLFALFADTASRDRAAALMRG